MSNWTYQGGNANMIPLIGAAGSYVSTTDGSYVTVGTTSVDIAAIRLAAWGTGTSTVFLGTGGAPICDPMLAGNGYMIYSDRIPLTIKKGTSLQYFASTGMTYLAVLGEPAGNFNVNRYKSFTAMNTASVTISAANTWTQITASAPSALAILVLHNGATTATLDVAVGASAGTAVLVGSTSFQYSSQNCSQIMEIPIVAGSGVWIRSGTTGGNTQILALN